MEKHLPLARFCVTFILDVSEMCSVAAIVVTFNRVDLLVRALTGIGEQTRKPDCIFVVDNASTDGTREAISRLATASVMPLRYIRLEENIGGAGGFYTGVRAAYESRFDMFWLMDDDTVPRPEALAALMRDFYWFGETRGDEPAFVCSTVLWKNEEICEMNIPRPTWDWPRFLAPVTRGALVQSASFVSLLVHRSKIARLGYPIKEFFIWYDDIEYTSRLASEGQPGFLSLNSKVHHHLAVNQGVNFALLNNDNAWKFRFGARNEGAVILRRRGMAAFGYFCYRTMRDVFRAPCSNRARIIIVRALVAALFFRYRIELPGP